MFNKLIVPNPFNGRVQKSMTQNQTINTALLTLGAFFVGVVPTTFNINFWGSIVCAVLGVGAFCLYELLP